MREMKSVNIPKFIRAIQLYARWNTYVLIHLRLEQTYHLTAISSKCCIEGSSNIYLKDTDSAIK